MNNRQLARKLVESPSEIRDMGNGWFYSSNMGADSLYGFTNDRKQFEDFVNSNSNEGAPFLVAVVNADDDGMDYYSPNSNEPAGSISYADLQGESEDGELLGDKLVLKALDIISNT